MSVLPSSNALSIQLNDRACLSLLGSIFNHVVVIFGIGFIAVQEKPKDASLILVGAGISITALVLSPGETITID